MAAPALARSPLHDWHAAHGARFVTRAGWQVVAAYTTADQETEKLHSGLGLADISACSKWSCRGRGIAVMIGALSDNPTLAPLGVAEVRGPAPALACRLSEDHVLFLSPAPGAAAPPAPPGAALVVADVTSALAGFMLIGAGAEELLRRLTHLDVRPVSVPASSCAETVLAGVEALLVRTAEPSRWRIYVAWDLGEYVWERLLEAGGPLGLAPLGLEALG